MYKREVNDFIENENCLEGARIRKIEVEGEIMYSFESGECNNFWHIRVLNEKCRFIVYATKKLFINYGNVDLGNSKHLDTIWEN